MRLGKKDTEEEVEEASGRAPMHFSELTGVARRKTTPKRKIKRKKNTRSRKTKIVTRMRKEDRKKRRQNNAYIRTCVRGRLSRKIQKVDREGRQRTIGGNKY